MKRIIFLIIVVLAGLMASCTGSSTETPAIMTLKEPINAYPEALAHGKLVRDGDCLKLTSFGRELYLVWPYGYSVEMDGTTVLVLDENGIVIARTGESIELGGGETTHEWVEEYTGMEIPEECSGTYWLTSGVVKD